MQRAANFPCRIKNYGMKQNLDFPITQDVTEVALSVLDFYKNWSSK